jgi:hypothetical protein
MKCSFKKWWMDEQWIIYNESLTFEMVLELMNPVNEITKQTKSMNL